jgi:GT2 family glycosyltransferase
MSLKPVTIAILNWNSRDMLAQCIESVQRQTYPAIQLEVLDNASSDGSVAFLREHYPDVPVTVFEDNLGFARAHNRGIRASTAPYYMPLNPDVMMVPTYVEHMVKAIELHEGIGIVGGKIFFMHEDGSRTTRLYSTAHLLTPSRSPTNRGYKELDTGKYEQVESVFTVGGAAPLYRRGMLEDIALNGEYFCEDFFLYFEDYDLGWRAQLRGWKCLYTPYAIAYHVGFGSGGIRSFRVQVEFERNRYLMLLRNDTVEDFLAHLPIVMLFDVLWQISRVRKGMPGRVPAYWVGLVRVLLALPATLRSRRIIQQQRRVSPSYIRSFFSRRWW